jgi:hypothetical protein
MKTAICIRSLVFFSFILPLAAVHAIAASVEDYGSRIEAAQKNVETMTAIIESDERAAEYIQYIRDTEASIKSSLPETETVDFKGSSIEISNRWLRTAFDQFDDAATQEDRIKYLSSISERLSAIGAHIKELEAAIVAERSKDEDKQKLNEILRREEYQKPQVLEKSLFQRWLEWFIDWISGIFPRANIAPVNLGGFQPLSLVLQVLIYALVIGLIGFLIYKFAPFIARAFRKGERAEKPSRVILGEHIDNSISASDLFFEAEQLARSGDLRGAIRKGYMALLCDLADRKVIGLARHKTNRDYLRDVRKRSALFNRVRNATGSFERHWYGFRTPSPRDWDEFTEQYRAAMNEARQ